MHADGEVKYSYDLVRYHIKKESSQDMLDAALVDKTQVMPDQTVEEVLQEVKNLKLSVTSGENLCRVTLRLVSSGRRLVQAIAFGLLRMCTSIVN